ncbi:MAG: Asp-tRNA(Asn)/Glu-tRNA(Gln) amidotransferase subunit GatB [Candidatus Nealsonbacteria bacterium]|nr:Asp-tRNA(Asn)/Glu-tRNA(Gln) amidotransferase subunit GatB [Candidatus Nealsonbacteria bacterium]
MTYEPVIGLEIHAELKTRSKMFCSSANDPNERHPNVNICPVCMGHPGTLPVTNGDAVGKVIKTGLALNCQIRESSKFDRKNYFYPDLPKGYQISQYDMPLCGEGFLEVGGKKIRITRVHLEEDTGRLLHPEGADYTLVDFNRAGVPLMELVTEPDISSGEEAWKFARELQLILRYLGVSDADMEKGQMRVEANISMSKNSKLGTKVEIKNLNSFRAVEKGIAYEIDRQEKILKAGKKVIQETRGWNEAKGETFSQRAKEEAHDYRYFPEPDLPPLRLDNERIREILSEIPEIPSVRRNRFKSEYQIGDREIEIFVFNKDLGEYFEEVMSELKGWDKVSQGEFFELAKICANYLISDLRGLLKGLPFSQDDLQITPENFAELMTMIHRGQVSSKMAKQVLTEMFASGGDPSQIIEERGLVQITDETAIEKIVKEVIAQNPNPVADFKKGKENALQFLMGQIMQKTQGRANPDAVRKVLNQEML